jgi:hypothetical protein
MASRSSSGIGVGITITLLGVVCLALFITTIVFLSKNNAAQRSIKTLQEETAEYVRQEERQNDTIARLRDTARKSGKSVVGYLNDSMRQTMQRTTGSPAETVAGLEKRLETIEGASSNTLLGVIAERERQIRDLNTKLEQADKDRQAALNNQANEAARTKALQEGHQKTIAAMNTEIERYKGEVDRYRDEVNEAKNFMQSEIERIRDTAASTELALNQKIRALENEGLQLKDQLAKLRGEKNNEILRGRPEESLVDASIISIDPGANTVTLDRGRRDKVVLGMQFAVYTNSSSIRPGPGGEYPAGKAAVEIINIGDASSTARVIQETRGNPIVRGDVVANAIYDPNKVYTFLVYGNFDANGDGMATQHEAEDVKAVIAAWGARTTTELTGDVDFLVLGQRPQLPPRPGVESPLPVVLEYQRIDQMANRYDELFQQATATSIPVLNENRLYTLIGGRPGRR